MHSLLRKSQMQFWMELHRASVWAQVQFEVMGSSHFWVPPPTQMQSAS